MDKMQRLVVTLLIVTVVLSIISVVINVALLNIDVDRSDSSGFAGTSSSSGYGGLGLVVESSPDSLGAVDG